MSLSRRSWLQSAPLAAAGVALTSATSPADTQLSSPATPAFQLGLVTYNVGAKWDLPTLLKVSKATGLAAIECRTTHQHKVEPTLTAEERKRVKDQFAASGVVFWGCGSTCEFHSPNPAVVEKQIEDCKAFIQLVADLGGKGVKVRPNGLPKEVSEAKTLEQIGKALIVCGKAAADAGVEIFVEVHGPGTASPPRMKTIMEHCNHPAVGVCWNSNPTDIVDGSIAQSFAMLKPWLKSCHINDLYNDLAGKYPYRELFRLLREAKYDRYTLIEVGRTPVDVASGEEMLRYYKALWTELAKG